MLKKVRVIGISSLLTWEGTRAFELESEKGDKETIMSNILDEQQWKAIEFRD